MAKGSKNWVVGLVGILLLLGGMMFLQITLLKTRTLICVVPALW